MASKSVQRHFLVELWKLRIAALINLVGGIFTLGMFAMLVVRWPQQFAAAIPVLVMAGIFLLFSMAGFAVQYGLGRLMLRRGLIAEIPSWNLFPRAEREAPSYTD